MWWSNLKRVTQTSSSVSSCHSISVTCYRYSTPNMTIPAYVPFPTSATPILPPPSSPRVTVPPPRKTAISNFPPKSQPVQPQSRKFAVSSTSSITTNVSDLLLSSLLPPNLPKLPQASSNKAGKGVRELSTQKEGLSLPLMSNNFRRFVTKVCDA
jgi:hypothetical protein